MDRKLLTGKQFAIFVICLLLAVGILSIYQNDRGSGDYSLTAYTPSLPAFAHHASEDGNEKVLEALDEAYDVEVLNKAYEEGISGETLYWSQNEWPFAKREPGQRDNEFYSKCRNAFIIGAISYPMPYLKTRFDQVVARMDKTWTPGRTEDLFNLEKATPGHRAYYEKFYDYRFNEQIWPKARALVTAYMEAGKGFEVLSFFYSPLVILIVYAIAYLILIFKRSKLVLVLITFNLHHLVVFLTAPAYYFMHYYSMYLGGVGLLVLILWFLTRKLKTTRAEAPVVE